MAIRPIFIVVLLLVFLLTACKVFEDVEMVRIRDDLDFIHMHFTQAHVLPKQEALSTDWPAMPGSLQNELGGIIQSKRYGYKCLYTQIIIETPAGGPELKKQTTVCGPESELKGNKLNCILIGDFICR